MSLNGFDNVSHFLRVGITAEQVLAVREPHAALKPRAQATSSRTATSGSAPTSPASRRPTSLAARRRPRCKRAAGKPAKKVGERRSPGQPDAGPLPGQKDISKPQVVLPPTVQKLLGDLPKLPQRAPNKLDELLRGQGPRGEDGRPPNANQLLDYLLAP